MTCGAVEIVRLFGGVGMSMRRRIVSNRKNKFIGVEEVNKENDGKEEKEKE